MKWWNNKLKIESPKASSRHRIPSSLINRLKASFQLPNRLFSIAAGSKPKPARDKTSTIIHRQGKSSRATTRLQTKTAKSSALSHRIGVIADTHNRWVNRVGEVFAGVDEIWHLGDVCDTSILDELSVITSNLTVILGNNDSLPYPLTRQLERGGERFHLIHIPPRRWPTETDWVLFGHTHVPCNEIKGNVHLFNPGSAGRANKGAPLSVGLLEKKDGQSYQSQIILL